ncbi:MAG TPA: methyltransferase domain-containing protein [Thermomicrobiales bacterium]
MNAETHAPAVNQHYGRTDLAERILAAVQAAGLDPARLTVDDLAPATEFHAGGQEATRELARLAGLRPGVHVLDVGGGIGGPARTLANEFGCRVTVLDLTEEFCRVGEMLSERTGMNDRVTFKQGNALNMPFADGEFEFVWTQHSSMNMADKERLYSEIARVLRPGGRLAIHEIMAGPVQPIHFPVPWARDPGISFLRPAEDIRSLIAASGFNEVVWEDVSAPALEFIQERMAAASDGAPPPVGIHVLLGSDLGPMFQNVARNLEEGRIAIIRAIFDRR